MEFPGYGPFKDRWATLISQSKDERVSTTKLTHPYQLQEGNRRRDLHVYYWATSSTTTGEMDLWDDSGRTFYLLSAQEMVTASSLVTTVASPQQNAGDRKAPRGFTYAGRATKVDVRIERGKRENGRGRGASVHCDHRCKACRRQRKWIQHKKRGNNVVHIVTTRSGAGGLG